MPVTEDRRPLDELAELGAAVFERQVAPRLTPDDTGNFVAVDRNAGEYEIDPDDYAAVMRLLARLPAADVWLMRAGYPTAHRMGGGR